MQTAAVFKRCRSGISFLSITVVHYVLVFRKGSIKVRTSTYLVVLYGSNSAHMYSILNQLVAVQLLTSGFFNGFSNYFR